MMMKKAKNNYFSLLVSLLVIGNAVFIFLVTSSGFDLFPEAAGADRFSTERAFRILEKIAREPRPLGSENHRAAIDSIVDEIKRTGIDPEIRKSTAVSQFPDKNILSAYVTNISCRLQGLGSNGSAVLLVAHYDSVNNSPGAADNGSSVAALLESLRVLKSRPPLSNDVIFLFTDAEEINLLGAKAFAEENGFDEKIKLVINFESRGNSGVVNMFQTSSGNSRLMKELARVDSVEFSNSMSQEIYGLLRNNTDLTVFLKKNVSGLNFANIDGGGSYHSPTDNLENIDPKILQDKGTLAVELASHFGSIDLNDLKAADDAVYFDFLGLFLVLYSKSTATILALVIGILLFAYVVIEFRSGNSDFKSLARSGLIFLFFFIVNSLITGLNWYAVKSLQITLDFSVQDDFYFSKLYFAGFAVINLAISVGLFGYFEEKIGFAGLQSGFLICLYLLLLGSLILLPGASFLLMWGLLFSLLFNLYRRLIDLFDEDRAVQLTTLLMVSLSSFGSLLFLPLVHQIYIALGLDFIYISTLFLSLLVMFQFPLILLAVRPAYRKVSLALLLFGAFWLILAVFNKGFTEKTPLENHLFYIQNTDSGKALWVSADDRTDEWTRHFFGADPERGGVDDYALLGYNNYLKREAQPSDLASGKIIKTCDMTENEFRKLCLEIDTPYSAIKLAIPRSENITVLSTRINDQMVRHNQTRDGEEPYYWGLEFWNASEKKVTIEITALKDSPVELKIIELKYGLPPVDSNLPPRPANMAPSHYSYSDMTLVSRTERF